MLKRLLVRADYILLAVAITLSCFGAIMVSSATRHVLTEEGISSHHKLLVQLFSLGLGLGLMFLLMSIDYSKLLSLAPVLYGFCILLLVVALLLGIAIRGSIRWIPLGPLHLQPAELTKIAVIIALAFYLSLRAEESDLPSLQLFLRAAAIAAGPALLILLQPDLGTPVVIFLIWLAIMFVIGTPKTYLVAAVVIALLAFFVGWETNVIKPQQKTRITAFINPEEDPHGTGWQLRQSLIAIGSGHLLGKGLFQGSQSNLSFIPDQETDFIFAVVGEELGFVGSIVLIGMLALLLWRCYTVAAEAKDVGGRILAIGVAAMFSVQVVVNLGMALGVMPIKGLPLPFVSYGGSAMLANFAAVGLVESVFMRRHKIIF